MMMSFSKVIVLTILTIINISQIINAFIVPIMCTSPYNNKLALRNGSDKTINCNKKYLYLNYLLTLRNVKKTIKNSANNDLLHNINFMIENIINSSSINVKNQKEETDSVLFVGNNSVIVNDNLLAKKILLANIQIDVSNIKYIQISTKNDTLIVELDKNNNVDNTNVIKYDLNKIDAMVSAISILMNLINVH
jgi:hypothetical protein